MLPPSVAHLLLLLAARRRPVRSGLGSGGRDQMSGDEETTSLGALILRVRLGTGSGRDPPRRPRLALSGGPPPLAAALPSPALATRPALPMGAKVLPLPPRAALL